MCPGQGKGFLPNARPQQPTSVTAQWPCSGSRYVLYICTHPPVCEPGDELHRSSQPTERGPQNIIMILVSIPLPRSAALRTRAVCREAQISSLWSLAEAGFLHCLPLLSWPLDACRAVGMMRCSGDVACILHYCLTASEGRQRQ